MNEQHPSKERCSHLNLHRKAGQAYHCMDCLELFCVQSHTPEPFPDPDVAATDTAAEPEASNDWGIREAFKTIERYIKPGSALPGAVLYLKREIRKLEKWVMEESGKRAPLPTDPIPMSALQIAMEAGSWFDRKDLSLPEREAEVVKILEGWRPSQPPEDVRAENQRLRKLFHLFAQDVIFFSAYDQKTDTWPEIGEFWSPCVILNDTFGYACADGERLDDSEIDRLIAAHKQWGHDGVVAWASLIRKSEPIEPLRTPRYHEARAALTKGAAE